MPTTTPRIAKDILANLDQDVDAAIRAFVPKVKGDGIKGADLMRILVATGHETTKGNPGLRVRSYMRSHGAWVGQGRTYGMTVSEARRVAAGYIGKVAPPAGVRYRKGQAVQAVKDGATSAEVTSAA